ncbi:M56 family metallopeptidase [Algibacter sp. 2305UL17-15]|uniref:M56 family metallopeptidase n=1 Tax=Algibacter sp. 2305UL17-15 TaxID=3231268 RepID=UPI00345B4366
MAYILKASTVIILFFVCYKVFLQSETFFQKNRWFFLSGVLFSFLMPLIVIPIYVEQQPLNLDVFSITDNSINSANSKSSLEFLDYITIVYFVGFAFFITRFILQIVSLYKILRGDESIKKDGITFIKTEKEIPPFSFFKWIVYNPNMFRDDELKQIIAHEKVHVQQYHSIDIFLIEIASLIFWFNPFIWFYSKALKQNLEFIADKQAVTALNCKKAYQYTLLKSAVPHHNISLRNNFYNSLIKKRIIMLHKSKSKRVNQLKLLIILPLVTLFLMAFNTKETLIEPKPLEVIITQDKNPIYMVDGKEITKEEAEKIPKENIEAIHVLKGEKAIEKYGDNGKNGVIEITLKTKNEKPEAKSPWKTQIGVTSTDDKNHTLHKDALYILDGKESSVDILKDIKPDKIESINVLKGASAIEKYGDKGKDGVVEITTKKTN